MESPFNDVRLYYHIYTVGSTNFIVVSYFSLANDKILYLSLFLSIGTCDRKHTTVYHFKKLNYKKCTGSTILICHFIALPFEKSLKLNKRGLEAALHKL